MENNDVILKIENLRQHFKMGRYENRAVNGISFNIKKGEVFGLVGESGCGKTTTGRTVIKLYKATDGNVWLSGKRIVAGTRTLRSQIKAAKNQLKNKELTSEQKSELVNEIHQKRVEIKSAEHDQKHGDATPIQMIFQDPTASLNPRMTVRDLIAEGLVIKGIKDKKLIDEKVFEALETVGLVREHANRYQHEFSGGQRQRIGIARAIILNPDLLIADEPVSALDVSIQAQVITLLNELREKKNLTVLFIAHNISVVKYFCDRIAVMFYGNIVEMASSEELFLRPMHPYTRALLSAVPFPDPNYEKQRKRILYNPIVDHDYREQPPSFKEVAPDHFVMANDKEIEKYKTEYNL